MECNEFALLQDASMDLRTSGNEMSNQTKILPHQYEQPFSNTPTPLTKAI